MQKENIMMDRDGAPSGVEGGRRPTGTPEGAGSTEVLPKAARRIYNAEYKRRIVREANKCEPGQLGALLRREGIYSSMLSKWRRQYDDGALNALNQNRGPRPIHSKEALEVIRLEKQTTQLKEELRQAHLLIDVQKKISELWLPSAGENPLPPNP